LDVNVLKNIMDHIVKLESWHATRLIVWMAVFVSLRQRERFVTVPEDTQGITASQK